MVQFSPFQNSGRRKTLTTCSLLFTALSRLISALLVRVKAPSTTELNRPWIWWNHILWLQSDRRWRNSETKYPNWRTQSITSPEKMKFWEPMSTQRFWPASLATGAFLDLFHQLQIRPLIQLFSLQTNIKRTSLETSLDPDPGDCPRKSCCNQPIVQHSHTTPPTLFCWLYCACAKPTPKII